MQQQFFSPPSNKTVEINETLEIIEKEKKAFQAVLDYVKNPSLENFQSIKKFFFELDETSKKNFIQQFIDLTKTYSQNNSFFQSPEYKRFLQIADFLAPFRAKFAAEDFFTIEGTKQKYIKEYGRYHDPTNVCRHFVFHCFVSEGVYKYLVHPELKQHKLNVDWKGEYNLIYNPIFEFNQAHSKKFTLKYDEFSADKNSSQSKKDQYKNFIINFMSNNNLESAIIRIEKNPPHVSLVVKEGDNYFVYDFTGRIKKTSLDEFIGSYLKKGMRNCQIFYFDNSDEVFSNPTFRKNKK